MRKLAIAGAFVAAAITTAEAQSEGALVDIIEAVTTATFVAPGELLRTRPQKVSVTACEIRAASLTGANCEIVRGGNDAGTVRLLFGHPDGAGGWVDELPPEQQQAIVSKCSDWEPTGCWAQLTGYPLRTIEAVDAKRLTYLFYLTDYEFVDSPED
ncbi:hypothetical protein [Amorphus coralli]|uniref:hypothetical protein n=1 Tax=Amorphus coralli TaxID=340680 RepID=UPI00037F14CA|nr:hypothetical protein [Amorphus coralli]